MRARARPGAALVVALAALVLLMALSLALHAVALRERRSARRALLVRAAMDGAEGALARWQVRLARGEPLEAFAGLGPPGTEDGGVPGTARELEGASAGEPGGGGGAGEGSVPAGGVLVRVTLVTFAGGVRLLVSDATATAAGVRARRRVSLLLVADALPPAAGDSAAADRLRPRLVPAPERAWAELP